METLEINEKGDYKIIMNENIEIEQGNLNLPQAQLITLGTKPNVHKSTIAIHIADNISKQNKPVAIFSLETTKQKLLEKLGNVNNIYIDDKSNIDITYIEDQCQHLIQEHNIKLVIIDYLQLIQGDTNINIVERLKEYAEGKQITIILLSQSIEELTYNDGKPILEDIKNKTLRDLIDSLVFLYDDDINKVETIIANTIENEEIITREEVMSRLKDKKLKEYSKLDLEERYIVYGTEQELEDPAIQRLLIKNNLYEELTDGADIITDKQVILELLQSNLFKDEHISIIEGEILDIGREILVTLKDNTNIYYSVVSIKDKATREQHKLKAQVFLEAKALNSYLEKIKPYYNNIVAIVSNTDDEKYIKCFMKSYEDIDYTGYCKSNS